MSNDAAQNQLGERFDEQKKLLELHCESYDRGEEVLALSIATAIRVFAHDTRNSISLLNHTQRKEGKFLSTSRVVSQEDIQLKLVRRINVGVDDGYGGEARYWALCDERYFSSPRESSLVSFSDWWHEKVFISPSHSLSRKDLVLFVANKDGGAHVDSEVDMRYDQFRKSWSGGSSLVGVNSHKVRGYDNIPTYPGVRQIGHELLHSPSFNQQT